LFKKLLLYWKKKLFTFKLWGF